MVAATDRGVEPVVERSVRPAVRRWIPACAEVTALLASVASAQVECLAPLLVSPVGGTTISETRPLLRLEPAASQATRAVRVKIDSRVPEGREVARIETRLARSDEHSVSFAVPRSLAAGEHRTKVRVELVAECGSVDSAPASAWFVIDTAVACAMPAATEVKRTASELVWPPAAAANEYQVCSATACRRTPTNRLLMSELPIADLVAITPICNDATGAARVITVE